MGPDELFSFGYFVRASHSRFCGIRFSTVCTQRSSFGSFASSCALISLQMLVTLSAAVLSLVLLYQVVSKWALRNYGLAKPLPAANRLQIGIVFHERPDGVIRLVFVVTLFFQRSLPETNEA